jgi:glycerate-2-kinase
LRGRHPVPDARVAERGEALLARAADLPEDAEVLVLVSGGGSALADAPAAGVEVAQLAEVNARLLACGARIDETNAVRASLSRLKAGGLSRALGERRARALVISDVPGHDASIVASGPMSRWRGPALDEVLARPHLAGVLAPALRARAAIDEDVRDVPLEVVADNDTALRAASEALGRMGREVTRGAPLVGEARTRGVALAREVRAGGFDALVAGGETTVTLRGGGRGGRNQELALAALIAGAPGALLSVGTDGIDGTSDAAGAFVDDEVRNAAAARGLDAHAALADNDSGTFFREADGALITGPTGTNVADLVLWVADAAASTHAR